MAPSDVCEKVEEKGTKYVQVTKAGTAESGEAVVTLPHGLTDENVV